MCERIVAARLNSAAKANSGEYSSAHSPADRPWDAAFSALIDGASWWRRELEEQAVAVPNKLKEMREVIRTDAPVGPNAPGAAIVQA